jgi:hypothetical protein
MNKQQKAIEAVATYHSTQVPLGKVSVGSDRQPADKQFYERQAGAAGTGWRSGRRACGGHRDSAGLLGGPDSVRHYLSGIFEEVERTLPGVTAWSFADDVAWWAEGKDDSEVAERQGMAAEAAAPQQSGLQCST